MRLTTGVTNADPERTTPHRRRRRRPDPDPPGGRAHGLPRHARPQPRDLLRAPRVLLRVPRARRLPRRERPLPGAAGLRRPEGHLLQALGMLHRLPAGGPGGPRSVTDRDPAHLHPSVRALQLAHQTAITRRLGIDTTCIETWRAGEGQDEAFEAGLTELRAGGSHHNVCLPDGTPASCAYHLAVDPDGPLLVGFGASALHPRGARPA